MLEQPIDHQIGTQKLEMLDYEVVALDQYQRVCAENPYHFEVNAPNTQVKLEEIRKDPIRLASAMASFNYPRDEEEFNVFHLLNEHHGFDVGEVANALYSEDGYNLSAGKLANVLHKNTLEPLSILAIADVMESSCGLEPEDIAQALVDGCQSTQEDVDLVLEESCNLDADDRKEILDSVFGEQIKP